MVAAVSGLATPRIATLTQAARPALSAL